MRETAASESTMVMEALKGCDFPVTLTRLERLRWIVLSAVRITKGGFVVTARNTRRHIKLYGKYGRVWTANFGQRQSPK